MTLPFGPSNPALRNGPRHVLQSFHRACESRWASEEQRPVVGEATKVLAIPQGRIADSAVCRGPNYLHGQKRTNLCINTPRAVGNWEEMLKACLDFVKSAPLRTHKNQGYYNGGGQEEFLRRAL